MLTHWHMLRSLGPSRKGAGVGVDGTGVVECAPNLKKEFEICSEQSQNSNASVAVSPTQPRQFHRLHHRFNAIFRGPSWPRIQAHHRSTSHGVPCPPPLRATRLLFWQIIPHEGTSDAAAAAAVDVGGRQGKTCIVVKDVPGFYVNR